MISESSTVGAANANAEQPQKKNEPAATAASDQECPKPPCPRSPEWWQTWLMGAYLALLFAVLGYLLLKLWIKRENGDEILLFWGLFHRQLQEDTRLLAIVMVSGALGGLFHAAKSFSAFVGNRRIYINWFWWYIARPLSGMALATIFYFLIRGGLLAGQVDADKVSIYGMAAMASLAGLFADKAALKLEELFSTLFKTDDPRKDKLDESAKERSGKRKPVITSISKQEIKSGEDAEVTITGTSFIEQSVVTLASKRVKSTFVSASEIKASLKAGDVPPVGSYDLIVVNPPPAGPSDAVKLKVIS